MGNCAKLKWNRRRLGLTQAQFAKKAGVSVNTINKLERDETAWRTMRDDTVDRVYAMFEPMNSWKPDDFEANNVIREIHTEIEEAENGIVREEVVPEVEEVIVPEVKDNSKLTKNDQKTYTLIEFAFEGLRDSENHEEFVANIKMLKRILDKY